MSTPDLHLQTLFLLNGDGRITTTREPDPSVGPRFCLVRGTVGCAWAVRDDVPQAVADELDRLAREEPSVVDLRAAPVNADRYKSLVEGKVGSGPACMFPEEIDQPIDTLCIEDPQLLNHNFSGWKASEVRERTPIVAVVQDGHAVSVCFCARRADSAAEAGLETAVEFRGRGFGTRVAAAWALAVRESGRIQLSARRGPMTPPWLLLASCAWFHTLSHGVFRRRGHWAEVPLAGGRKVSRPAGPVDTCVALSCRQ